MFQDSVPAGSYNDPFLSSVCVSHCFVQSPLFFPNFRWVWRFFGFVLTFSPLTLQKVRKLEFSCRLCTAEHCWVLLSAAECAAVCCWEIQFPTFFHLFCVCFPIVFVQISLFFRNFWWILWYLLGSFSALSPAKTQETSKLVVDWELLSTAEKCNPQPFSICFAEVFMAFATDFDGF